MKKEINSSHLPDKLIPFFWYFIRPYKNYFFGLVVINIIIGLLVSITPYILKLLIDTLTGVSILAITTNQLFVLYIFCWCLEGASHRVSGWIWLKTLPEIRRNITNNMYEYLSGHSHSYFQNNLAGSLQNKINDMTGGSVSILRKIDEAFAQIIGLITAFIVMFSVHPRLTILFCLWSVSFLTIAAIFSKKVRKASQEFSLARTSMSGKIIDSISNMALVRSFARKNFESEYIANSVDKTVRKDRNMQYAILYMHIGFDCTILSMIALMLWNLLSLYQQGQVTIGDFTFIMMLVVSIFMSLWWLVSQFIGFAEELGKCSQSLTIIQTLHEVVDSPEASILQVSSGEIIFDQVTFYYNKNNRLFEKQDMHIGAGEKVGLVGFSGSGKSSFVSLIMRFFDLKAGTIKIDGQNIAKVTQSSLRQQISVIPQDTSLFHRTIMENIRYGNNLATDEEVYEAAKKAYCHEFINILPEGYNSLVGERGIKLSGGQRQRIAIARAMLKGAPILILDEATSALDSVTEKQIQAGLHTLMAKATTIVIAHRLSTLLEMDRILVFEKGKITEIGSHQELLGLKGQYRKMWQMQNGGFLPE